MIHDIDILQAVQQKLKERFPYPVYLQEVKEGFRPPAFFLKTMTVASPQGRKEVYRDTDMYITYIPQKQTASASIYEVLAAAEDLFRDGIAVQDRFFCCPLDERGTHRCRQRWRPADADRPVLRFRR